MRHEARKSDDMGTAPPCHVPRAPCLFFRSLLFNILFYGETAFLCFGLLWALALPRRLFLKVVRLWLRHEEWLERHIAGIRYQVIGREHIPSGPCIIAAKHQSAWETFKLHLLFGDPAIVLKEELLQIPIWGWYASRAGMIPIDRGGRLKALTKMMSTAEAARDEGRKIVIFPQGTRVAVGEQKAYKSGVAALYQKLNIPIVPMAVNSGVFWPKNGFLKKPGLITIAFLPPIPHGLPRDTMMKDLRERLEAESERLAFAKD